MNSTFTALGVSGTGKTCYIVGLYNDIQEKNRTFSMTVVGHNKKMLENWVSRMNSVRGADKFPSGTSQANMTDYQFVIHAGADEIISIDWLDYPGGILHKREDLAYTQISSSIEKSTALYIFIDGDKLCYDSMNEKIRHIRRDARVLNTHIQRCADSHSGKLPPVIFVITKTDKCNNYLSEGEIEEILKVNFSSVFCEGNIAYIVPVSLGKNIDSDDYLGPLSPLNIHIPLFVGVYHNYENLCRNITQNAKKFHEEGKKYIANQSLMLSNERSKLFFHNKKLIASITDNIAAAKRDMNVNLKKLNKHITLISAVANELVKDKYQFMYFANGEKLGMTERNGFISRVMSLLNFMQKTYNSMADEYNKI